MTFVQTSQTAQVCATCDVPFSFTRPIVSTVHLEWQTPECVALHVKLTLGENSTVCHVEGIPVRVLLVALNRLGALRQSRSSDGLWRFCASQVVSDVHDRRVYLRHRSHSLHTRGTSRIRLTGDMNFSAAPIHEHLANGQVLLSFGRDGKSIDIQFGGTDLLTALVQIKSLTFVEDRHGSRHVTIPPEVGFTPQRRRIVG